MVPLVSIIFSTIYVYNSSQFIELLLSQPIARGKIWLNIFIGLSSALILAYLLGCGVPILLYSSIETGFSLIIIGVMLSVIFTAFAMLSSIGSRYQGFRQSFSNDFLLQHMRLPKMHLLRHKFRKVKRFFYESL